MITKPWRLALAVLAILGLVRWAVTGRELTTLHGHDSVVRAIAFSPDGLTLVSASDDKTLIVWDANSYRRRVALEGHTGKVTAVACSAAAIVSASEDGTIRVWDSANGLSGAGRELSKKPLDCVAISPDGKTVAAAGAEAVVFVMPLLGAGEVRALRGSTKRILALAFAADGQTILGAGEDGEIRLWDVASGKPRDSIGVGNHRVYQLALSPDGSSLAAALTGPGVRLWGLPSRDDLGKLERGGQARCVNFSADREYLATGHEDRTVKLWAVRDLKLVETFEGHRGPVLSVAFAPDGRLASAGGDGTIKFWPRP